jgi:hypothetical protein
VDGSKLYVRLLQPRAPAVLEELDLASGARRPLRELMPSDPTGVGQVSDVFFARDGRSYAYHYVRFANDLYLIDGLR